LSKVTGLPKSSPIRSGIGTIAYKQNRNEVEHALSMSSFNWSQVTIGVRLRRALRCRYSAAGCWFPDLFRNSVTVKPRLESANCRLRVTDKADASGQGLREWIRLSSSHCSVPKRNSSSQRSWLANKSVTRLSSRSTEASSHAERIASRISPSVSPMSAASSWSRRWRAISWCQVSPNSAGGNSASIAHSTS
jgi:hypothetical protein